MATHQNTIERTSHDELQSCDGCATESCCSSTEVKAPPHQALPQLRLEGFLTWG